MFITDPETDEAVDTPDPATAAVEAETPDAPVDEQAEMLAAMDEGIASESPEPEAPDEPIPGTNEAKAADDAKAEADKAEAEKAGKDEPDKETEDEITALGLKEKAAQRFRDLTSEVKTLAPIKAQLEAAGIKDVSAIPRLAKQAEDGAYLLESIEGTGVTPEDFTRLLAYGSTIAAARSGDRAAVERAFEEVGKEYAAIAKALGKEVPGVFDPLAEFTDLAEAIESGDMTRKHALEVAQARRTSSAVAQRNEETQAQTRQQQEQQAAVDRGVQSLRQWEQAKVAQDPTYASKRAALNAKVAEIRKQFPPAQWAAATDLAYQALAAVPAPAPRPQGNAVRPGGPRAPMAPAAFDSMEAAMDYAITETAPG